MKRIILASFAVVAGLMLTACGGNGDQSPAATGTATITIHQDQAANIIPDEIYGQFAEHLGAGIYGGIWVGKNSSIPNTQGYRNDVLEALRELEVPVIRWPGGCFADYYHWEDGIGDNRPAMVNSSWGGTVENNSFGTHEFLNLCEMLGCEPYISGNVGSGSVQELANWVLYMTADGGVWADLRAKNGRKEPWKVKYLGVGNESWGCGGQMTPEYYAGEYRRYAEYCRDYGGNHLFKVASGASDYDYDWTEVLMAGIGQRMDGISLHYYSTTFDTPSHGKATDFDAEDYYWTVGKSMGIEPVIRKHIAIMDKYDPENRIKLLVDEWGTWWDVEEGTNPGHLFQQNTMRDAIVAATTFDIFHKYTERINMTNIAQMVNVLQAMILTQDDKMLKTPTYFVYKMYNTHRGNKYVPAEIRSDLLQKEEGRLADVHAISSTTSVSQAGKLSISVTNVDLDNEVDVTVNLGAGGKAFTAEILTSPDIKDYNSFDEPAKVGTVAFSEFSVDGESLTFKIPAHSIVTFVEK